MGKSTLQHRAGGFTLIETVVATAIVGTAATALMVAIASSTRVNSSARELTQATYLVQEIREWTYALPFSAPDAADTGNPPGPDGANPQTFVDDLDDLMNVTFCPPRNGNGLAIAGMNDWSQHVTMSWRNPQDLGQPVPDGDSDVIRVQVDVLHAGQTVLSNHWFVTRRSSP